MGFHTPSGSTYSIGPPCAEEGGPGVALKTLRDILLSAHNVNLANITMYGLNYKAVNYVESIRFKTCTDNQIVKHVQAANINQQRVRMSVFRVVLVIIWMQV